MISGNNGRNTRGEDPVKRRARNRLSQRAYRLRQSEKVRELQRSAEAGSVTQNEAFERIRNENYHLRKQLVDVQSTLTKLTETLQSLTGSVSNVLHKPSTAGPESEAGFESLEGLKGALSQDAFLEAELLDSAVCSLSEVPEQLSTLDTLIPTGSASQVYQPPPHLEAPCEAFDWQTLPGDINCIVPQIPHIWSHEYQMGLQPYMKALSHSASSSLILGKPWVETNSPFSDHISTLRDLMRTSIGQTEMQSEQRERPYRQVLGVLALFNSLTRPAAMAWYAKTKFYHIVDLTVWQLYPCPEMLSKVHTQYKPTMLQLQHQYPSIIDWAPFPALRDRLIRLHAANPQIDQIFVDIVSSYVVEACLADLVFGAPPTNVYVRVTDVAEGAAVIGNKNVDPSTVLPAADTASLFSVPECAQAVFKLLNMDHGVSQYKLDPSFFGTYPELFDPENDISAKGVSIRPNSQTRLPCPSRLDDLTFQTYRSFMAFHTLAPS